MAKQLKGIKHDAQKIRVDLLSTLALEEIAKVLTFGAAEYADDNWRLGFHWRRLLGAELRHIFAFMRGEDFDRETGISHLAHAGCCIMFLLEHQLAGLGVDDRWDEHGKMPVAKRRGMLRRGGERTIGEENCATLQKRGNPSKSKPAR